MPVTQPCIICRITPSKDKFHGALECRAYGNYGSTIYDPIDSRTYLRFTVCDGCMGDLARKGLIQEVATLPRPSKITAQLWSPDVSDD
jgi:hypothetical protein